MLPSMPLAHFVAWKFAEPWKLLYCGRWDGVRGPLLVSMILGSCVAILLGIWVSLVLGPGSSRSGAVPVCTVMLGSLVVGFVCCLIVSLRQERSNGGESLGGSLPRKALFDLFLGFLSMIGGVELASQKES